MSLGPLAVSLPDKMAEIMTGAGLAGMRNSPEALPAPYILRHVNRDQCSL